MDKIKDMLAGAGGNIVLAIVISVVGYYVIKYLMKLLDKVKGFEKLDPTVTRFVKSFIKWLLYIMLIIGVIGILGVPMAQVIAVLASAGVAIGLALQGALSNLAGGILLMIVRPFNVGDYVDAAGASGVVQSSVGFAIDANERANRDINGLITGMEATGQTSTIFCGADNSFHDVSLEDLKTMLLEIIQYGQRIYAVKWQIRIAIEQAKSMEELAAINVSFEGI